MEVIPAIDLKEGKSVRLYQGDFKKETVIDDDPIEQAKEIERAGLNRLHVVDLNGAKSGRPINISTVQQICEQTNLKIEVGGGIRNMKQINDYLTKGVSKIILGSTALTDPDLVAAALKQFGADQIVVGVDAKGGKVAIQGWLQQSNITINNLIENMAAFGVKQFIVTDIQRDGTLSGANIKLLTDLKNEFNDCKIIASGGVSNQKDLMQMKKQDIDSVIVGKAMSMGEISLSTLSEVNNNAS